MRCTKSSRPPRSNPAPGSSSNKSSGSDISALAIKVRLRSPSDKVPKVRFESASNPQVLISWVRRYSSINSYFSRHLPVTPYAPVSTTFSTLSEAGRLFNMALLAQPIRGFRSARSTAPSSSPRRCTCPEVGNIWAAASCRRVVLPAPLGPRITQRSGERTTQFTSFSSSFRPRLTATSRQVNTSAWSRICATNVTLVALVVRGWCHTR